MPSGTSLSRSTVQRRASGRLSREANSSSNNMLSNSVGIVLALHQLFDQIKFQLVLAVSQLPERDRQVRDGCAVLAEHIDLLGRFLQTKKGEHLWLHLRKRRSGRRMRVHVVLLRAQIAHVENQRFGIQSNSPE